MKSALYHQNGREPILLQILNEHANGTVDLGDSESGIIVSKCLITESATPGAATLVDDSAKVNEDAKTQIAVENAAAEKAKAEADAKAKAEADAKAKAEADAKKEAKK